MNILGLSCFFHDAAAALVQDGIVTAAAEEERFSRIKHDASFPLRAIEFCLRTAKLRGEDLDWVVFYEKPFVKFDRILMSTLGTYPQSFRVFRESMIDRKSTRLNSSHSQISYAVFCLKKKNNNVVELHSMLC